MRTSARSLSLVALPLLACAAVLLGHRAIVAQVVDELSISWSAPVQCPDQAAIVAKVQALLSRSKSSQRRRLSARGHITQQGGTYTLHLETTSQDGSAGQRTLEGPSCEQVSSAVAVILALAIDATLAQQGPSTQSETPPADEPGPSPAQSPDAPDDDAGAPARAPGSTDELTSIVAGAGLMLDFGSLPRAGHGPTASVGVQWPRWKVMVDGVFLPATFAQDEQSPRQGGFISLIALGPSACFFPALGKTRLGPCAGLELGTMYGRGHNLENQARDSVFWLAGSLAFDVALTHLRPVLLRARVSSAVPFFRPPFEYERKDGSRADLHTPGLISPRAMIFTEFEF